MGFKVEFARLLLSDLMHLTKLANCSYGHAESLLSGCPFLINSDRFRKATSQVRYYKVEILVEFDLLRYILFQSPLSDQYLSSTLPIDCYYHF